MAARTMVTTTTIATGNARYRSDEKPGASAGLFALGEFRLRPERDCLDAARILQRGDEVFLAFARESLLRRPEVGHARCDLCPLRGEALFLFGHAISFLDYRLPLSRVPRRLASPIGA